MVNTAETSFSFGSVPQGTQIQHKFRLVSSGLNFLRVLGSAASTSTGVSLASGNTMTTLGPGGAVDIDVVLDTGQLAAGSVSSQITVHTDDPQHPTQQVTLSGTVAAALPGVAPYARPDHPWDEQVFVPGAHSQFDSLAFTVDVEPDPATVQPCLVLNGAQSAALGVGSACGDFAPAGAVTQDFGDGRDGDHIVNGTEDLSSIRGSAVGAAGSTTLSIGSITGLGFQSLAANAEVLIHQSRGGVSTGQWELAHIQSASTSQLTLTKPLLHSYATDGGASRAQVVWVPQFRNLTIGNGTVVAPAPWSGTSGGIEAFMVSGTATVSGTLAAKGTDGIRGCGNVNNCSVPGGAGGFQGDLAKRW
jgi:hypothetical protein